jgi:predicted nucleic-acid-binding protein
MYVLTSPATYRPDHAAAATRIEPLLEMPGIQLDHKSAMLDAITLFVESRKDFEDCIAIAHARRLRAESIVSYERELDRVSPIPRTELEPLAVRRSGSA